MKASPFLLQLAIVFLPGVIWARLDAKFAAKTRPSDIEFFVRAFLFGITSHIVTFAIYSAIGRPFELVDITAAETAAVIKGAVAEEVAVATGVGFGLALLWLYGSKGKWLTRFLQSIGATKRHGDEDIWDFTFNSGDIRVSYVHFRDLDHDLVYSGWLDAYSETEKVRELVLRDVEVHSASGELLYETPLLYLARSPEKIHIEFPYRPEGGPDEQR